MYPLIHAIDVERRCDRLPERVRSGDATNDGARHNGRSEVQTSGASLERGSNSPSRWRYSRPVRRVEHALFAVVLVTVGYVYLGALLVDAL